MALVLSVLVLIGSAIALMPREDTSPEDVPALETSPTPISRSPARSGRVPDDGLTVPRIFLPAFPDHMTELPKGPERKAVFIAALLPHVLKVNELIAADRQHILDIAAKIRRGGTPSDRETNWLRAITDHYGLKAREGMPDMDKLLLRVQVIPPSLALTQAAIESGWGASRFATEGNAAFGQRTWDGEGLIPARRRPGDSHRIRNFDHLFQSVASYMHNLNTHRAYAEMRARRAALAAAGKPVTGAALAPALVNYSERREAYVADVLAIMADNNLERADRLRLAHGAP